MHNQQKDETCGQECGNDSRCKKPKGHDGSCNPLYGMTFAAAPDEDTPRYKRPEYKGSPEEYPAFLHHHQILEQVAKREAEDAKEKAADKIGECGELPMREHSTAGASQPRGAGKTAGDPERELTTPANRCAVFNTPPLSNEHSPINSKPEDVQLDVEGLAHSILASLHKYNLSIMNSETLAEVEENMADLLRESPLLRRVSGKGAQSESNCYWDIFTADDGGRLLRLCWRKNDAGNFMAMEFAELVTWNNAAEQKEAEEFVLQVLNVAEKNREWLRKRADGEDKHFLATTQGTPEGAK